MDWLPGIGAVDPKRRHPVAKGQMPGIGTETQRMKFRICAIELEVVNQTPLLNVPNIDKRALGAGVGDIAAVRTPCDRRNREALIQREGVLGDLAAAG